MHFSLPRKTILGTALVAGLGSVSAAPIDEGTHEVKIQNPVPETKSVPPVSMTIDPPVRKYPPRGTARPRTIIRPPNRFRRYQFSNVKFVDPGDPNSLIDSATLHVVVDELAPLELIEGVEIVVDEVDGYGDSGEAWLATETATEIELDLIDSKYLIAKDGTFLHGAFSGTTQILGAGNDGLSVVWNGTTYTAANGTTTVTVLENGPAYARILLDGTLAASSGLVLTQYHLEVSGYAFSDVLRCQLDIDPNGTFDPADLAPNSAWLLVQTQNGMNKILDPNSLSAVVLDPAEVGETPADLQMLSLERTNSSAGLGLLAQWNAPEVPIAQLSATTWGVKLWPTVLPQGTGGLPGSASAEAARLEFSFSVHEAVPTDLDAYGRALAVAAIGTFTETY